MRDSRYGLDVAEIVLDGIASCGHEDGMPSVDEIAFVTDAYDSNGADGGTERDGCFVALLKDGRWLAAWDSEDYTGHGCQCSGGGAFFSTREEALRLGIGDYERGKLEEITIPDNADALARLEAIATSILKG
jgi:hypothetical protein